MADLEVLEGWFQNQRLLVITSLINLCAVGSDYLWLNFVRTYDTIYLLWWVRYFYLLLWVFGIVPIDVTLLGLLVF